MIEYIKYRYRLAKLLRDRRAVTKKYEPLLAKEKSGDDMTDIMYEEHTELVIVDDQIHRLVTNWLWEQAKKSMIPIPSHDEEGMWEETESRPGTYHLSVKGVGTLRAALRKENKERWETLVVWVAPITGLVGALTGLLAIIMK